LNGLWYLHCSHILHRDLKPANILITSSGVVKIGDLGLARLIYEPLQPLFAGDKVVVTIWYRAPELLLGAKHYNKAVDCWAVACVMAELANLRPIFKGEEAKLDSKKNVPFQRDQLLKIFEVLGTPDGILLLLDSPLLLLILLDLFTEKAWPGLAEMPEYPNMKRLDPSVLPILIFSLVLTDSTDSPIASMIGAKPVFVHLLATTSCANSSLTTPITA
jgi:cyclin-dependent kinase 8/11